MEVTRFEAGGIDRERLRPIRTKNQTIAATCLGISLTIMTNDSKAEDTPRDIHYRAAVEGVELEISDQVKGGCWINADSVLTAAKLVLSRSDIRIVDTEGMIERAINMDKPDERPPPFPSPLSFVMSAIGYDLKQ